MGVDHQTAPFHIRKVTQRTTQSAQTSEERSGQRPAHAVVQGDGVDLARARSTPSVRQVRVRMKGDEQIEFRIIIITIIENKNHLFFGCRQLHVLSWTSSNLFFFGPMGQKDEIISGFFSRTTHTHTTTTLTILSLNSSNYEPETLRKELRE